MKANKAARRLGDGHRSDSYMPPVRGRRESEARDLERKTVASARQQRYQLHRETTFPDGSTTRTAMGGVVRVWRAEQAPAQTLVEADGEELPHDGLSADDTP